ncbi:MAG: ribonuclease P protein component [Castellaniella sp.]
MRATFDPAARLHRPSEYARAMKGRRIARGALFVLRASLHRPANETGNETAVPAAAQARLGMIVAKRFAPLAVSRNAIKRVLRDAFRHRRHRLPAGDYVFRLHAPIGDTSLSRLKRRVRAEADQLLERATAEATARTTTGAAP